MLRAAALMVCVAAIWLMPDVAAAAKRHRATHAKTAAADTAPPAAAPDDDLYRRRGYGTGGLIFGLRGQGGTSMAGACADLSFTDPRSCGPRADYGVYGNGLGYGFGL